MVALFNWNNADYKNLKDVYNIVYLKQPRDYSNYIKKMAPLFKQMIEFELDKIVPELIENDKVEAIVVLPRELFITTDISVTLWILNQNKRGGESHGRQLRNREHEILFMDLRQWTENPVKNEQKKKVRLITEQIERASEIYHTWQSVGTDGTKYEVPELYRSVGIAEIEEKGWALTPSKYIEFIDHDLDIDYKKEMSRIQKEMQDIMKQEKESQTMLEEAFKGIG